MEDSRRELAPIALYALAFYALLLSAIAWQFRAVEVSPSRWNARSASSSRHSSHAIAGSAPRHARPYRPALAVLAPRPTDYVRRVPGPVLTAVVDRQRDQLQVLAPTSPLWSAPSAPCWTVLGYHPRELGALFGVALADTNNHAQQFAHLRPVWRYLVRNENRANDITPLKVSATVKTGPGERLARVAQDKPARSARTRTPRGEYCECDAIALRSDLSLLLGVPEADAWARKALATVDRLNSRPAMSTEDYLYETSRLNEHAIAGHELAARISNNRTAVLLRKASYSIERRAVAWQIAKRLDQQASLATLMPDSPDGLALMPSLRRLAARGDRCRQDNTWIAHLRDLNHGNAEDPSGSSEIALRREQAITRLRFAERPISSLAPLSSLNGALEPVTPEPVDVTRLIQDLEQYELKPRAGLAERIALRQQRLSHSRVEDHRRLAGRINQDYRNANLRIAIKDEFLRRQVPQPEPNNQPVRDKIAGTPVRGHATTDANLSIQLTPDPHAWRLALVARGQVESRTVAYGGPARLHSRGTANFVAEKPLVVHSRGVQAYGSECSADSHNQLVGVRSDFDGVPLVARLIRARAEDEFRGNQSRAQWETERRVSAQVRQTLDQQADEFIKRLRQNYNTQVQARADTLGLNIEPIEVRTTEDRVIARLRLANDQQLGAHTPRNRAPVDSVLSLQMHESLLNNAIAGLDLAGKSMTPEELREEISAKLSITSPDDPETEREEQHKVAFLFDATQPTRVVLTRGKVELIFAFEELAVDRSSFRKFKVHAFLTPSATIEGLWLTQEDPVQIEGRLRAAKRAKLHTVFAKVMPAGKRFTLATTSPEQRSRLAGLMVTQVVVDDGWLGLALGPQRQGRIAMQERFVR